jgi:hypothetical protein
MTDSEFELLGHVAAVADEALQRIHDDHTVLSQILDGTGGEFTPDWMEHSATPWWHCRLARICRDAAVLFRDPNVQSAMATAREARRAAT